MSSTLLTWRDQVVEAMRACPWRGPMPYEIGDTYPLIARDGDIDALALEVGSNKLVVLPALSGVGKTSLLNRGLIPRLAERKFKVVSCRAWTGSGEALDAATFLAERVHQSLGDPSLPDGVAVFAELANRHRSQCVLLLDQFEELIRDAPRLKEEIFDVLALLNKNLPLRIVISLRSEYVHELVELEDSVSAYGLSMFKLSEVGEDGVRALIDSGNDRAGRTVVDAEAREVIVQAWLHARDDRSRRARRSALPGLLHMQALLYSLHGRAAQAQVRDTDELRALLLGNRPDDGAPLFEHALRAAIDLNLERCTTASEAIGLDPGFIAATRQMVARSVVHLSSSGYKLVRDVHGLIDVTLGAELATLDRGIRLARADGASDGDGSVTDAQRAAIIDTLIGSVTKSGEGPSDVMGVVASPLDLLEATVEEIAITADGDLSAAGATRSWKDRLHIGGDPVFADAGDVSCGRLLGRAPAEVLIEELRRFAFALQWLQTSSLIRLNTPFTGEVMVALIHDGYGDALNRWSAATVGGPDAARCAISAPAGAEYVWWAPEGAYDPALDGDEGARPPLDADGFAPIAESFVNVRWRGAFVRANFRQVAFVNCDLRGSYFAECRFEGVTFVNCLLDGAMFTDCTIAGSAPSPNRVTLPRAGAAGVEFELRFDPAHASDLGPYSQIAGPPTTRVRSPLPGLAARPYDPADGAVAASLGIELGSLVVYGGRVSSLVVRNCRFDGDDAVFALRGTAGSGFDIVEHAHRSAFALDACRMRHFTITSSPTSAGGGEDVTLTVTSSVLDQAWFGHDLHGAATFESSDLLQVWNGSPTLRATASAGTSCHEVVGVGIADDAGNVVLARTAADFPPNVQRDARAMDYRTRPAERPDEDDGDVEEAHEA